MKLSEDYFKNIEAMPLGKRRMSRLEVKRVLKSIAQQRKGFDLNWISGTAAFMKSYPVKQFPRWFATVGDKVEIQVSIRLIPGKTAEGCEIPGLSGLEVYYRFKKTLAKIKPKEEQVNEIPEDQRTEAEEFDTRRDIVELTDWRGSILISSSMAVMFYRLLRSIGINKVEKTLARIKDRK